MQLKPDNNVSHWHQKLNTKIMKQTFTILLTLFVLSTFGQHSYDTSKIVVIQLDTTRSWAWNLKGNKPASLTNEQILLADSIVQVCISEHNNNGVQTNTAGMYIGIKSFKMQFVPTINDKGEIIIWANCLCEDFLTPRIIEETKKKKKKKKETYFPDFDWRKEIIVVHDGGFGGCFFNVQINLTTKQYFNLMINGI